MSRRSLTMPSVFDLTCCAGPPSAIGCSALAAPHGGSAAFPYDPRAMQEIGRGTKVFDAAAVSGTLRIMEGPDDVLTLMDTGADGVIALVRDAGATFLAPLYHELAGIVCTSGTPRSHIGIVSREFQVPCAMAVAFADGEPSDGSTVELDCSGTEGLVRG